MGEVLGLVLQLASPLFLLLLGLLVGRAVERAHFRQLRRREAAVAHMLVTDIKTFPGGADPAHTPELIVGQAVIATDYLKSFLAGLRKILGGELKSYLSLMERARREALLRVLEQAQQSGFNAVCNLRLDTADIGGAMGAKGTVMVSLVASGTAYRRPLTGTPPA
jgi:uncharacterized protein YbjQ (UPF0145 family)